MSGTIERYKKIEVRQQQLREALLKSILYHLEQKKVLPEKGINLIDPRAPQGEWLLATVQINQIEASGKCHCELYHGDKDTYELKEFSTDSLFELLTLFENGK